MSLRGWTIAFDLDGTLVDTAPDLIGSLNAVLAEEGLPSLPLESARSLVGRGARMLIERGFAEAGQPLEEGRGAGLVRRFLEVYKDRIALESRPFPGVVAALDDLAREGARLCVCTNKPSDLSELLLTALDLRRLFGAVVGADAAPKPKPDASHLLAALHAAGGDPQASIMVGDSETDVLTARAAGVPVVVVPFGYTEIRPEKLGADRMTPGFPELPAILADIAAAQVRRTLGQAAPATALIRPQGV